MTPLPNGCRISNLIFKPSNWKTKSASVAEDWYCKYRFYDSAGNCKAVTIKGVNRLKTAAERKELLQQLVDQDLLMLRNGWNPISKRYEAEQPEYGDWDKAITAASENLSLAETTRDDFNFRIGQVKAAAHKLGYDIMPVTEVRKRHLKEILKLSGNSAYAYNKQRAYLLMIYKELSELDIVDVNYIKDISKKKTVKKIRETLTIEQRQQVDQYLKKKHYTFWRYLHIFFHSGSRSTQLLALKYEDVDLKAQRFKTVVKKGQYREEWGTIKDIALPLWEELMKEGKPGDYLFSHGLKPGIKKHRYDTITRNWWKWVKKPLKITADFYSLKHLNTSEIVDLFGDETAATQNAHTSTAMVKSIYDVKRKDREHEKIKKANNKFA